MLVRVIGNPAVYLHIPICSEIPNNYTRRRQNQNISKKRIFFSYYTTKQLYYTTTTDLITAAYRFSEEGVRIPHSPTTVLILPYTSLYLLILPYSLITVDYRFSEVVGVHISRFNVSRRRRVQGWDNGPSPRTIQLKI